MLAENKLNLKLYKITYHKTMEPEYIICESLNDIKETIFESIEYLGKPTILTELTKI